MPQPIGEDETCDPKLGQTFCGDFLLRSDFWTLTALDGIVPDFRGCSQATMKNVRHGDWAP